MKTPLTAIALLSGGAAQGLVNALLEQVTAQCLLVRGTFGAVGLMRDQLLAGAACDVFISTASMLSDLAQHGHLDASSIRPLGRVATGIAVQKSQLAPHVADADSLRAALLAAPEVHCPDTRQSTAGIHFAQVLRNLGIEGPLAARLHTHPNGMTAMRAVAASSASGALGCTQITEILHTPGVQYAGDLPEGFGLHTVYAAAAVQASQQAQAARRFLELLCGATSLPERKRCGFVA